MAYFDAVTGEPVKTMDREGRPLRPAKKATPPAQPQSPPQPTADRLDARWRQRYADQKQAAENVYREAVLASARGDEGSVIDLDAIDSAVQFLEYSPEKFSAHVEIAKRFLWLGKEYTNSEERTNALYKECVAATAEIEALERKKHTLRETIANNNALMQSIGYGLAEMKKLKLQNPILFPRDETTKPAVPHVRPELPHMASSGV